MPWVQLNRKKNSNGQDDNECQDLLKVNQIQTGGEKEASI